MSVNDTSQKESESEPPDDVTQVQERSVKRKAENKQEKSGRKGKRRRRDVPESTTQDWQSSVIEMWEQSMEQYTTQNLNVRRKCSVKPRAGKWNKQTPFFLALKTF